MTWTDVANTGLSPIAEETFCRHFAVRMVLSVLHNLRTEFVDCTEATTSEMFTLLVGTHCSISRCDFFVTAGERMATRASSAYTFTNCHAKSKLNTRSWALKSMPMSTDLLWRATTGGPFLKTVVQVLYNSYTHFFLYKNRTFPGCGVNKGGTHAPTRMPAISLSRHTSLW
jgi:hypothetical protein